jgi:hypothetical protein
MADIHNAVSMVTMNTSLAVIVLIGRNWDYLCRHLVQTKNIPNVRHLQ